MRRRRFWLIGAFVLLAIGALGVIFLSSSVDGENPYSNAGITASTTNVKINMDVEEMILGDTKTETDIIVTVNNMPSGISREVIVTSENTNVATARVVARSGDKSTLRITAINGGETRIKVMSSGGNKVTYIKVVVDVPAKDVDLKVDTAFGVMKPTAIGITSEVVFNSDDFDFYATEKQSANFASYMYTPTIKDLTYAFSDTQNSLARNGIFNGYIKIEGNKLTVNSNVTASSVNVLATLVNSPDTPAREFKVYIFENFGAVSLNGFSTGEESCELVKNEAGTSYKNYAVSATNSSYIVGTNYGFYVTNRFERYVLADYQNLDESANNFMLIANGVGEGWVDVILYPIANEDGKLVKFNLEKHAHLQKTKRIYVEVRNIFKSTNPLRINNQDTNSLTVFYAPGRISERTIFNLKLTEEMTIHNTTRNPSNANVVFNLSNGESITDAFYIYYNGMPITTVPSDGLAYDGEFAFILKDESLLGRTDLTMTVRSVSQSINLAMVGLNLLRSVSTIDVYDQLNSGLTTHLYPVVNSAWTSLSGIDTVKYDFYVDPIFYNPSGSNIGLTTTADSFRFEFVNPQHEDLFEIQKYSITNGRLKCSINIKSDTTNKQKEVDIGTDYKLKLIYASGASVELTVSPIGLLKNIEDMTIRADSNGLVYPEGTLKTAQGSADFFTVTRAAVRVGGTYSFSIATRFQNNEVWLEIVGGVNGGTAFYADTEGTKYVYVRFHALNDSILPAALRYDLPIKILVINPLLSVELDQYAVNLISRETLYTYSDTHQPELSLATVNLMLNYFGTNATPNWPAVVTHTDTSASTIARLLQAGQTEGGYQYVIQGLRASNTAVAIEFTIVQTITDSDGDIVLYSTVNRPLRLSVNVKDATLVEEIVVHGEGGVLLGDTLNLDVSSPTYTLDISTSPNDVTAGTLGYSFEVDGQLPVMWENGTTAYKSGVPYVKIENGVLTVYRSNIQDNVNIALFIGTYDSMRNGSVPTTYKMIVLNIFDSSNSRIISTREEFLDAFYTQVSGTTYQGKDFSQAGMNNGYYRITNDIDLRGYTLYPIQNFAGTIVGTYQYNTGNRLYESQYSIQNFTITQDTGIITGANSFDYGMFSNLLGTVEGLNFTNVTINFSTNIRCGSTVTGTDSIVNLGVVASQVGITGIIRDVVVDIVNSSYQLGNYEKLNFGIITGTNSGRIEEEKYLHTSGFINIKMASEVGGAQIYKFSIGGLVGYNTNTGVIINANTKSRVNEQNITHNSSAVLALTGNVTHDNYANGVARDMGGLVGTNYGQISNMSSETVLYNSTRGNTGGLVGMNSGGTIADSYSNGAIYARGAIGGVAGLNNGYISYCYYDFIINQKLLDGFALISKYAGYTETFYAGLVAAPYATNVVGAYATIIGGITGVNYSTIISSYATSAFDTSTTTVLGATYRGDIYLGGLTTANVTAGAVYGTNSGSMTGNYARVVMVSGISTKQTLTEGTATGWMLKNITSPNSAGGAIDFDFRTGASPTTYSDIYGRVLNNLGGMNYVVPAVGHATAEIPAAALFYTSGSANRIGNYDIANKYYLEDVFADSSIAIITPSGVASARFTLEIVGQNQVAKLGIDTLRGQPKYYIEVMREGTFELVAYSTRSGTGTSDTVAARALFDVVPSMTQMTLSTNAGYGEIAYKSLIKNYSKNYEYNFAVRKDSQFWVKAAVNSSTWQVEGMRYDNSVMGYAYKSETPIAYNNVSNILFEFTPYIEKNGNKYLCTEMKTTVTTYYHRGSTELTLAQNYDSVDASSSAVFSGVFVTDVSSLYPAAADKLRDLASFSFEINDKVYPLFVNGTRTVIDSGTTSGDLTGKWKLVFNLSVEAKTDPTGITIPVGFTRYEYKVLMSVEVGSYVYESDLYGAENIDRPMEQGFNGVLHVVEHEVTENFGGGVKVSYIHEKQSASCPVEVFAQEVQAVNFKHFSKTSSAVLSDDTKVIIADFSEQFQNNNIYVDTLSNGNGGILRIETHPTFACVDSVLELKSNTYKPVIYDADGNEIATNVAFDIMFVQLVLDKTNPDNPYFVRKSWNSYLPVSSQTVVNGVTTYEWDGTYYFETMLRRIGSGVAIDANVQFDITVTLRVLDLAATKAKDGVPVYKNISNIASSNTYIVDQEIVSALTFRVVDRPGLTFNYDNDGTRGIQAVGTTHDFTTQLHGKGTDYVLSGGVPVATVTLYNASGASEGSRNSWLVYKGDGNWTLNIDSTDENLIGKKLEISVAYKTQEFGNEVGSDASLRKTFTVDIVLFKVQGFYADGVSGHDIRLGNGTMQSMRLRVDAKYYGGSANSNLSTRIDNAISDLETKINNDTYEYLRWSSPIGVLNQGTIWNTDTKYYEDSEYGSTSRTLNYMLGKDQNTKFITSASINNAESTLSIEMGYSYDSRGFVVLEQIESAYNTFAQDFNIATYYRSSEGAPLLITNVAELKSMQQGEHYIIMNDIEISNWEPIPFVAASLDGNNKKIKLVGFNLENNPSNIGLFTTIGTESLRDCVIKNVNLVIPDYGNLVQSTLKVDLTAYPTSIYEINVGALAGINYGTVTNCAVLPEVQFEGKSIANYAKSFANESANDGAGTARSKLAVYVLNSELILNVGGLVGINEADSSSTGATGVISNSRVLIDVEVGNPFTSSEETTTANIRTLVVAGFVAVNKGTIVASFFRDASIKNTCLHNAQITNTYNYTAGFVGINQGRGIIDSCYAMGLTSSVNSTTGAASKGRIISQRANAAGFVYLNGGTGTSTRAIIKNCYTSVITSSSVSHSGFIYQNQTSGIIQNCFVNNPRNESQGYASFYFNNSGQFTNNKFINLQNTSAVEGWTEIATGDLTDITKFTGFSISATTEDNIWKITAQGPRLVSTSDDNISISIREQRGVNISTGSPILVYLDTYEGVRNIGYGQKRNPIIITSGAQFNAEIYESSGAYVQHNNWLKDTSKLSVSFEKNLYQKHIRLANYITLANETVQSYQSIYKDATFDGNGLEIRGITFNATDVKRMGVYDSVGLFSKLENATVKNLKLSFIRQGNEQYSVGFSDATYSGGLAGQATNSKILDIELSGAAVTSGTWYAHVLGGNITGGLVGLSRNSIIENVTSNISVESRLGFQSEIRSEISLQMGNIEKYISLNHSMISVAGGLVGYAGNGTTIKDIGQYSNLSVKAEVVGGLVGVIDKTSEVHNITYLSTGNNVLSGEYYIGGLAGVNLGLIEGAYVGGEIVVVPQTNDKYVVNDGSETKPNFQLGMVVGGAAGYNSGNIRSVVTRVAYDGETTALSISNSGIWVLGGIVGDNFGGTVYGCDVRNVALSGIISLSGGFYVGGVAGYDNNGGINLVSNETIAFTGNLAKINTIFGKVFSENGGSPIYYFANYVPDGNIYRHQLYGNFGL